MVMNVAGEQGNNSKDIPEHLKRYMFKPGESGNPSGRPKGTFSIRRMIAEKMQNDPEEAKEFIELIYRRAKEDNDSKEFKYIETIIESIDGKVTQPVEQTTAIVDLTDFNTDDLQAFREWLKERKAAQSD